jgi:hypothetical protein
MVSSPNFPLSDYDIGFFLKWKRLIRCIRTMWGAWAEYQLISAPSTGARNSIGVFLWSARSQIDIRHFPFPRVPGVDGGSSA